MNQKQLNKTVKKRQDKAINQVDSFIADLQRFLELALEEIIGELEDGNVDPALALGKLIYEMKKRGMIEEIGKLRLIYKDELKRVDQAMIEYGIDAGSYGVTRDTLSALIKFNINEVENKTIEVIGQLRPLMLQRVLLGQNIALAPLRAVLAKKLYNQIKTEINTAMLTFSRLIVMTQAIRLGFEKFIYNGPDDSLTRPFCKHVLEKRNPPIYKLSEINKMDNKQGLDVKISGGGYNCRHEWRPVDDELEATLRSEVANGN